MTVELTVVVPAFDEAELIGQSLEALEAALVASGHRFEIVVVDDGSRDETARVVAAHAQTHDHVRLIELGRNRGKGRALETGCFAARGDVVVLLDADLEIPPDEVGRLVRHLEAESADLVVGSKYATPGTAWPRHRRWLSRIYQAVTAVLFRLPLRDTQTGIKAMRRELALEVLPHVRSRRFAWDLEFVLLAHKAGRRTIAVPVRLEPTSRASRVGVRGALLSGVDTLRIFIRDRCLGCYAPLNRRSSPPPRIIVSGDDLGLAASVDRGLVDGIDAGALTSVSVLAHGATLDAGLAALDAGADVGLHVDLYGPGRLAPWLLRAAFGLAGAEVAERVAAQLARLRSAGRDVSHADAHRHAYLVPWVRRRFVRALREGGVPAVRSLRPLGPLRGAGRAEALKRLLLLAAATCSAGVAREHGVAEPDGFVDAGEAARWVAAGRVPARLRGRTIEVVAHPMRGADDLPEHERGGLDRAAETRAVFEPPLADALRRIGAVVVGYGSLAPDRRTR